MWRQLLVKWGVFSEDYHIDNNKRRRKRYKKRMILESKSTQTSSQSLNQLNSACDSGFYESPVVEQRVTFLTPCSGGPSCSLNSFSHPFHQHPQQPDYFIQGADGRILPVIRSNNCCSVSVAPNDPYHQCHRLQECNYLQNKRPLNRDHFEDEMNFEDEVVLHHEPPSREILCFGSSCQGHESSTPRFSPRLFTPNNTSCHNNLMSSSPTDSSRASTLRSSFRLNIDKREQQLRRRFSSTSTAFTCPLIDKMVDE
jgi:hypothetical protein